MRKQNVFSFAILGIVVFFIIVVRRILVACVDDKVNYK